MAFDWAAQATGHLDMILDDIMVRYGVPANIVPAIPFENVYDESDESEYVYPEEESPPATPASNEIMVLLSKPVEGLWLNTNFISYADKIETQYAVIAAYQFNYEDRVDITYPDGHVMSLRIVEVLSAQALSELYFRAVGIVVGLPN